MNKLAPVLLLLVATIASATPSAEVVQEGSVTVTKISQPKRQLKMEVQIPAPSDSVWQAFTTSDGLETWLWEKCSVDLKPGGEWLALFGDGKNGGGTIQKIKRGREITIHAMAPEQYPTVRSTGTTAVFSFEPVDKKTTRVRLVQTGWQSGDEWDRAYEYLAKGNAQLLGQLRYRFVKGPIDWTALHKQ